MHEKKSFTAEVQHKKQFTQQQWIQKVQFNI